MHHNTFEDTVINRQLYNAVNDNNFIEAEKCIAAGANPSATICIIDDVTYNPLITALKNRNPAIVHALLESIRKQPKNRQVDFSQPIPSGTPGFEETWFHHVCLRSSAECARLVWAYQIDFFKQSGLSDEEAENRFAQMINKKFYKKTSTGIKFGTAISFLLWRMSLTDLENTDCPVIGPTDAGLIYFNDFLKAKSSKEMAGKTFPANHFLRTRGAADMVAFLCEHGCDTLHVLGHNGRSAYHDAKIIKENQKTVKGWGKLRHGMIWSNLEQVGDATLPEAGKDVVVARVRATSVHGVEMTEPMTFHLTKLTNTVIKAAELQMAAEAEAKAAAKSSGDQYERKSNSSDSTDATSSSDEDAKELKLLRPQVQAALTRIGALEGRTDVIEARQDAQDELNAEMLDRIGKLEASSDAIKEQFKLALGKIQTTCPEYAPALELLERRLKTLFLTKDIATYGLFKTNPSANQRAVYNLKAVFGFVMQASPFVNLFAGLIDAVIGLALDAGFAYEESCKTEATRRFMSLLKAGSYARIMSMLLILKTIEARGAKPGQNLIHISDEFEALITKAVLGTTQTFNNAHEAIACFSQTSVAAITSGKILPVAPATVTTLPTRRATVAPGLPSYQQHVAANAANLGAQQNSEAPAARRRRFSFFGSKG